jgi:hypothetical protein
VGLKLNGTHRFLAYADDVNLLGDNIISINKTREISTAPSKDVVLEINVEKTMYISVFRDQNADQDQDIKKRKQIV